METKPLWETNPLTDPEIATLESLLARARPLPRMQWPVLRPMWQHRLMPFNPIELVVLRQTHIWDVAPSTETIYCRRAPQASDQEHWPSAFHFPGSYLGGGEHIDEAIQRILHREIAPDAVLAQRQQIATTNLPRMKRNHDASLIYLVTLQCWPSALKPEVAIHRIDQSPTPLIPHHVALHQRILDWVQFFTRLRNTLPPGDLNEFLRITDTLESDVE